jgi:carbonic anhydrase
LSSTDTLVANAESYAVRFDRADAPARPATGVAVVACMDARLNPAALLSLAEGDAHVIRNAGGVVTDDVVRSLIISQRMLGTTEVVLLHHSECGMLTFRDDDVAAQLEAETGDHPQFALGAFTDLDANVRESMALLRTSPFLPHRDAIRGFVYDVKTGGLREVTSP